MRERIHLITAIIGVYAGYLKIPIVNEADDISTINCFLEQCQYELIVDQFYPTSRVRRRSTWVNFVNSLHRYIYMDMTKSACYQDNYSVLLKRLISLHEAFQIATEIV